LNARAAIGHSQEKHHEQDHHLHRSVTMKVEGSTYPNWTGTEQKRSRRLVHRGRTEVDASGIDRGNLRGHLEARQMTMSNVLNIQK
jgi:hypothetical protein